MTTRAASAMQQGLTEDLYLHVDSYRDSDEFSAAERLAIEYAERFALEHREIDDAFFARLGEHFSPAEILELTVTIGYCMGIGRALAVLDIANECEVSYTKEPPAYDHA
jgi:alkylhydroperoxidase family enzyme